MDLVVILKKLEDAYNQEDWNIIEEIIETISYAVENDSESLYYDEQYDDEIDLGLGLNGIDWCCSIH